MTTKLDVAAIHAEAHAAGMRAGHAVTPKPMTVVETDVFGRRIPGAPVYRVDEGMCGFAWVSFKGNTAFGRQMKRLGIASRDYPTGLCVWVGEFGQSIERKEAYARAYAEVLRKHGIEAYANSRLD